MNGDIDVLIPARRGSVGLPGKNTRILVDRPLALHSIACAQLLQEVRYILVSTDDPVLAQLARDQGAYVPILRPSELSTGTVPMADVVRHAVTLLDECEEPAARYLLLLDPTSPIRNPEQINQAVTRLRAAPQLDGAISVSVPAFNPLWVGVELGPEDRIRRHSWCSQPFSRRQDVPPFWRINGNFYIWQTDFARHMEQDWLDVGNFIGIETPEILSHSIDTLEDFNLVETLVASGLTPLPWLEKRIP